MLTQQTIQKILGINEKVHLSKGAMVEKFNVTFSPYSDEASTEVRDFSEKLKESFERLNVKVVPYNEIWIKIHFLKRVNRFLKYILNNLIFLLRKTFNMSGLNFYIPFKTIRILAGSEKIKKGVCVVCIGEQQIDQLQMQHITNFKDNSIITIVDFPKQVNELTTFENHFDTAMSLFAYHMTNIILAVDKDKMMVYNFNASHPIYSLNDGKFDHHILETLIPKVVAPISPHKLNEFDILDSRFDPEDESIKKVITELKDGASMFANTKLYPSGKKIDDLPFRHSFHKLIGKLHLDKRSGMSFGFISHQMPASPVNLQELSSFKENFQNAFENDDLFINKTGEMFITLNIHSKKFVMQVPEVWVMTLRSGSDKTHFDPNNDLIKLGLKNGKMLMQFQKGLAISSDYKPSFDTKVILAHAIGNVIVASILKYINSNSQFANNLKTNGLAISHWHGYFKKTHIPKGIIMYGIENPHVSCSSPQSAIYALGGKLSSFQEYIKNENTIEYKGDIHIEPHHGINIVYPSLVELATYILKNPEATELGNKYLYN
jgi:hypothetical protein